MLDRPFQPYGKQGVPTFPHVHRNDSKVLIVTGKRVDTIESTGAILQKWKKYSEKSVIRLTSVQIFLSQIENFCRHSASMKVRPYGEPHSGLSQALYRIPVGDQEMLSSDTGKMQRSTMESEAGYKALHSYIEISNNSSLRLFLEDSGFAGNWAILGPYLSVLYRMSGRRPFITKNGYLDINPANLKPNDQLCIFIGAHTPYIIRALGNDCYLLVGDAYVYGVMDGKFMENNSAEATFLIE